MPILKDEFGREYGIKCAGCGRLVCKGEQDESPCSCFREMANKAGEEGKLKAIRAFENRMQAIGIRAKQALAVNYRMR